MLFQKKFVGLATLHTYYHAARSGLGNLNALEVEVSYGAVVGGCVHIADAGFCYTGEEYLGGHVGGDAIGILPSVSGGGFLLDAEAGIVHPLAFAVCRFKIHHTVFECRHRNINA